MTVSSPPYLRCLFYSTYFIEFYAIFLNYLALAILPFLKEFVLHIDHDALKYIDTRDTIALLQNFCDSNSSMNQFFII